MPFGRIFPGFYIATSDSKEYIEGDPEVSHVIVFLSKGKKESEVKKSHRFEYLFFEEDANESLHSNEILQRFDKINKFIEEGRSGDEGNGVWIFGLDGDNNTSTTYAMGYVIWKLKAGLTLKEAFETVRDALKGCKPSPTQAQHLKIYYDHVLNPKDSSSKSEANKIEEEKKEEIAEIEQSKIDIKSVQQTTEVDSSTLHEKPKIESVNDEDQQTEEVKEVQTMKTTYHCRKCRMVLFDSECIVPHDVGKGQTSFSYRKRTNYHDPNATEEEICTSWFIDTDKVEWMAEQATETEGKLNCQKCSTKIGNYKWDGGQCSCGGWQTPCFQVLKKSVDARTRKL